MRRRDFLGAMGAGAWALSRPSGLTKSAAGDQFVERWSWAMGQAVHVMLFAPSEGEGLDAAAAALAELRQVESRLSLFDDASDLVELNRLAGRSAFQPDRDLLAVLQAAERYRRSTAGAFDVAVEPLMRVWGFHARRTVEPTAAEITEARDAVAAAVVWLDGDRVRLPSRHTQLDLGGIGVGYGLDRAAGVLRSRGITRGFIDVSGDCIALGAPPGRRGWPVGLAGPRRAGHAPREVVIHDLALATSANTASVMRYGSRIRGHVMDPASGYPADRLLQVTVVAETGIGADALSTAMLVAGKRLDGAKQVYLS